MTQRPAKNHWQVYFRQKPSNHKRYSQRNPPILIMRECHRMRDVPNELGCDSAVRLTCHDCSSSRISRDKREGYLLCLFVVVSNHKICQDKPYYRLILVHVLSPLPNMVANPPLKVSRVS